MEYVLKKRPKKPVIIEGFPGYGLVGTISTEYLIKQLNAKPIGYAEMKEVPPVVAVHQGCAVEPLGLFYAEKQNILIVHALAGVQGFEWQLADLIVKLAKDLDAKEVISLEGVGGGQEETSTFYLFGSMCSDKKINISGVTRLEEGIIMGVAGALLLKEDIKLTCFFASTHSTLPDSKAAASLVKIVNIYLNLGLDMKPLVKRAESFEAKLREVIKKSASSENLPKKEGPGYFG